MAARTLISHASVLDGDDVVTGSLRCTTWACGSPERGSATVAFLSRVVGADGNISLARARIGSNSATQDQSLRFYEGPIPDTATPGNILLFLTAGLSDVDIEDLSGVDTVTAGNSYCYGTDSASGAGASMWLQERCMFEADGPTTYQPVGANSSGNPTYTTDNGEWYFNPAGGRRIIEGALRERAEIICPDSYNWTDAGLHLDFNERITNSTMRSWIDGAEGNSLVTVPPGVNSTVFYDLSGSDSVVQGQHLTHRFDTGTGGGRISFEKMASAFTSNASRGMMCCAGTYDTINSTGYYPTAGMLIRTPTEADAAMSLAFPVDLRNLTGFVSRASGTADVTLRSRVNGADGNCTVTVFGGVGDAVDLTGVDELLEADTHSTQVSTANGTTSRLQSVTYSVLDLEPPSGGTRLSMVI